MPFSNLEEEVLNKDLCTVCGACQVACPRNYILFDGIKVKSSIPRSELNCGDCNDCLKVCPGSDPETYTGELELFGRARKKEERWLGIYNGLVGGKAVDISIFNKSAGGGSTTTILKAARDLFNLDFIVAMGRDDISPWKASPKLIANIEELVACCQSTYQLMPYLNVLNDSYLHHNNKNFAIVGVACHVQAIRKLQRLDSDIGLWARNRIKFIIEIACSSNTRLEGTESMITGLIGVSLTEVKEIRFREGEYPGQIMVLTKDNKKHYLPFWKAVQHFKDNKTHRCLSCGDWLSGLADISISDGDPNIFKASLGLNNIAKHGRIFIRTEPGKQVVEYARANNLLETWPVELEGENLGLERKRNRRAFYERADVSISAGPIPGYEEAIEIIEDATFLAVSKDR